MVTRSKARKPVNPTATATPNNNNNNNKNDHVTGRGSNVTPTQVAFFVDRYLSDNNLTRTRSIFHSELLSIIPTFNPNQAPNDIMNLWELIEEYIMLKGQKLRIEQEKCGLAQESCRIKTLLHGMQGVMNAYNSSSPAANCILPPPPPPPPVVPSISVPPTYMPTTASAGFPESRTQVTRSVSTTQSVKMDRTNFVTPTAGSRPPRKRRINYKDVEDAPQASKKIYSGPLAKYPFSSKVSKTVGQPSNTSLSLNFAQGGTLIQGSSVAENLFDKPLSSPNSNSSSPKTPPQVVSTSNDEPVSLLEDVSATAISHHRTTPPETAPTNCTIFSSKTIILSPAKRYSIERNECTFSSPAKSNSKQQRESSHVKSRLDFDSSDVPSNSDNATGDGITTSDSEKEGDIFDLDLQSLDAFGPDFSLTDLLTEFGINCDNLDYSCPTTTACASDAALNSLDERNNVEFGTSQDLIELSSTEVAGDKTVNGSDSITSVTSVRKRITIVSPTKGSQNNLVHYQENLCGKS